MANKIIAFVESREGKLHKSGAQCISAAKMLQNQIGGEVIAILLGAASENDIKNLGKYGASKVLHNPDPNLNFYSESYAKVIADKANEIQPLAVFLAATAMGKDLGGRIAAKLETALANDCVELFYDSGKIKVKRPVFGSKALVTAFADKILVCSLRPNVFQANEIGGEAVIETFASEGLSLRDRVKEVVKAAAGKLDVAEAEIIVSGGRGLGNAENYKKLIIPLAEVLGAANGASRAIVDDGWREHSEQVGQTGKTVAPKLYIACGISGAIQHLAGMSSSRCIVAINKDPDAPIFKAADYGIIGDVNEVIPVLIEEFKKILAD